MDTTKTAMIMMMVMTVIVVVVMRASMHEAGTTKVEVVTIMAIPMTSASGFRRFGALGFRVSFSPVRACFNV